MAEEKKEENSELNGISAKLLKARTIIISQQINAELTAKVLNQLVLLEQEDSKAAITVFINSPGERFFPVLRFLTCFVLSNAR